MTLPKSQRLNISETFIIGSEDEQLSALGELNNQLDELYSVAAPLETFTGTTIGDSGEPYVTHGIEVPSTMPGAKLHSGLSGADLHEPKSHNTTHEQGQSDSLTFAAPNRVGPANAAGSGPGVALSDHDHGLVETGGPTNLTIGAIADNEIVSRSGTALVGSASSSIGFFVDHVIADGGFALVSGPQTNLVLAEYAFVGSSYYAAAASDEWTIERARTGAGTITVELFDFTNSLVIGTITVGGAAGPLFESPPSLSNIPSARARIQLRVTVPVSNDLTINSHYWARKQ